MKLNVSETESGVFENNAKTNLQIKKSYLMPPSRHDYFHPILILPVKIVELPQQHANTTGPLVVNPTITNCCKELHLNVAEFLDPFSKMLLCTKAGLVLCENQFFFLLFRNVATIIENYCFFLLLFTIWWSIFDQLFRLLLPLSCFLWIQSVLVQSQNNLYKIKFH